MKKTTNVKRFTLIALLGAALAVPVFAQQGNGAGGMGNGPGMQKQGAGMGKMGGRGMRFNQDNVSGWTLMTPAERSAQQAKMRSSKSYAECKQLQSEHRVSMEERAKEKGVSLPTPRQNGCDRMQARGFFQ